MIDIESLPEWDAEVLAKVVGNRPELMQRFYDKFLTLSAESIAELFAYHAQANWQGVSAIAHKLKSAARAVGANKMGGYCEQLELTAPAGESAHILDILHQISVLAAAMQSKLQARSLHGGAAAPQSQA